MSKELVSDGNDFLVEWVDRAFAGKRRNALQVSGADGSVLIGGLKVAADGTVTIAGASISGGAITADTTISANHSLIWAAGSGGLDASAATGAFKIGASSATLAFYGASPVAKASAYTQTYSTAAKTVPNATSHTITDSSGGAASTSTIAAITTGGAAADQGPTADAIATLAAELALVKADLVAAKKVINALIDDLQALGLVG